MNIVKIGMLFFFKIAIMKDANPMEIVIYTMFNGTILINYSHVGGLCVGQKNLI